MPETPWRPSHHEGPAVTATVSATTTCSSCGCCIVPARPEPWRCADCELRVLRRRVAYLLKRIQFDENEWGESWCLACQAEDVHDLNCDLAALIRECEPAEREPG